ncbi:hypothetical protein DL766_007061 [Monosporascus sp. MC13-8B]|uniref:Uncharacterized protein n=1 Tax=Monosporascus cannonballus TaxID=155416 RepID=A0ABY0H1S3_9PEZI|nr:hypothetical protein DL762_006914 [Monosporascus cannonballus]RYO97176.1 hypothetical protein DL763_002837 [Monosporascus cannonballus]RYP25447.1 hypothetical protein DL766_007061 [Monosporascus sp. MC13-8B]
MIPAQSPRHGAKAPVMAFPEKHSAEASSVEVSASGDENNTTRVNGKLRFLVASPYTEREHLLDLDSLDSENVLLAEALALMKNVRLDYATASYIESFNWDEIMEELTRLALQRGHRWRETSFFIVAFRSRIPPTTAYEDLGVLDKAAHAEATASGGFLNPDNEGRNLATCVWRSLKDAKAGNVGPAHRRAAGATRAMYSHWKIDRHRLTIRDDLQSWELVDWTD